MKHLLSGLSLVLTLLGILACDVLSTPVATDDAIATGVAGTLAAQGQPIRGATATLTPFTIPTLNQSAPPTSSLPTLNPSAPPTSSLPTLPPVIAATSSPPVSITTAPPPTATSSAQGYYNLVMRYSKNCLSLQGSQAVEATCNQASQLWDLPVAVTGDYFQIHLLNGGGCLGASSNHETDAFVLMPCGGGDDQLWQKRMSGGYFQLVNKTILAEDPINACIDARQWGQPLMQWPCKPWGNDDQLDNQLFCQTSGAAANCAPPAGVYVTNIQQDPPPYTDEGKPNTFHVYFRVSFSNTTGSPQTYSWFVRTFGTSGGQTPQQKLDIQPGLTTVAVGPWNIGHQCNNYTAKAQWVRSDGLTFTFKDSDGAEYALPFQVCKP